MLSSQDKVKDYLKKVISFSALDAGITLAETGGIAESNKTGRRIRGMVKDPASDTLCTVTLELSGPNDIEASCSCSTVDQMQEQWCLHAVALVWNSFAIGFTEQSAGFDSYESLVRMASFSSKDVAAVMLDLASMPLHEYATIGDHPDVEIQLDTDSDRLGIAILFDGKLQEPSVIAHSEHASSRALDHILLRMIEEHGIWDSEGKRWYVNASDHIERIVGIIQEYNKVFFVQNNKPVTFEKALIEARLNVEWNDRGVSIDMCWVLPNGTEMQKDGEVIGTGPYWVAVADIIYKLSPTAARIASLFPYNKPIFFSRSAIAPILEMLRSLGTLPRAIREAHTEKRPEAEVVSPTPRLQLVLKNNLSEHFSSGQALQLQAILDFDYPIPPKDRPIVYLPDRQREEDLANYLERLGFVRSTEGKVFNASGDTVLDVAFEGAALFPEPWIISGLSFLQDKIKFSDLTLHINLTSDEEKKVSAKNKRGNSWFDCSITLSQNNSHIPLSSLFKPAVHQSDRWIKLDSGAFAQIPGGSLQYLKTTLGVVDHNYKLSNTIKTQLSVAQAVQLSKVSNQGTKIHIDKRLQVLQDKLTSLKEIPKIKISNEFQGTLRRYQEEGVRWLNFLNECELGGILADEMGLGKTVQTLAYIRYLRSKQTAGTKKPVLIVCPTSVITNWAYEIRRFVPTLSFLMLQGPQRKNFFGEIEQYDIVLTTYALLRIDRGELENHLFDYIILDEAQNIKNPRAAVTKAAKALRAKGKLVLTGTPTENRPLELWSLIDFVMPGYLGSGDYFKNFIEKPLLEGVNLEKVSQFLNSKTKPFILRRAKNEVEKDLPPKIESVMHVAMTQSQAQLYAQVIQEVRPKVFDAIQKKGTKGATVSILAALLRLRQICNHPYSIEALKRVEGFDSGKFQLFKDLVKDALDSGRKILVFSQFLEMMSIMRNWLEEEKVNYLLLDGQTKERQLLVDKFNEDESVRIFLMSLKAGGTGLNLTAADTVIIYDPWWNPAVENQAIDRAHRIGQTKSVTVYRLVTEDSVEQKIMTLKDKKSKLVDALIGEGGISSLKLSKSDIENLFSPVDVSKLG